MKILGLILPVAFLVAYSQVIVKWRISKLGNVDWQMLPFWHKLLKYFSDPIILSAYTAAFFSSLFWMYIVTKLPLAIAFPIYIGTTFVLVIIGGWFFLGESVTWMKLTSAILILVGIVLGVKN